MTDKRPQTIQFFLPQGEPRGIRMTRATDLVLQQAKVLCKDWSDNGA